MHDLFIPDCCIHLSIFCSILEYTLDCPVTNDPKLRSGFVIHSSKWLSIVFFKLINKSNWEFVISVDKSDIWG